MISRIDSTMARTMPCSTPTAKTTTAVMAASTNSLNRAALMPLESLDVDQADADEEHDRGEHRLGHVGEHPGEEQHDDEDDHRHGDVGDLGASLLLVEDLGLGGAAVHHEGAGQPGGEVRTTEPDEVTVDVDALAVFGREAA